MLYERVRLISCKINNFRVLKEVEIDFPDKVIGIIGPNGAGKSSIIEAIAWALYGNQVARSGKEEIKSVLAGEAAECSVELIFQINEETYRIERKLIGKSNRAEVQLYRGKGSESVGVAETKGYIEQLLGLDWRGFLSSFLARQSELNALSDLQPSKRRDHIAGMLGINRLDKVINRIKAESKSNKERIQFFENRIQQKDDLLNRQEAKQAELNSLNSNLAELLPKLDEAKTDLVNAEKSLKKEEGKLSEFRSLTAELNAQKSSKEYIEKQLLQKEGDLISLNKLKDEIPALEQEVVKIEKLKEDEKKLNQAKIQEDEKNELLRSKSNYLKQKESSLNAEKELIDKIAAINVEIEKTPENLTDQIADFKSKLEEFRRQYAESNAEKKSLEKEAEKIQNQLDNIEELGSESVCDKCLQPLGDNVAKITKHLQDELNQVLDKTNLLENKMNIAMESGQSTKSELEKYEKLQTRKNDLKSDLSVLKKNIELNKASLGSISANLDNIEKRLAVIGEISFDKKVFEELTAEITELEEKKNRLIKIKGQLEKLDDLKNEITEQKNKISELESNNKIITEKISELSFDEKKLSEITNTFNKSRERLDSIKTDYNECRQNIKVSENEIKNITERLEEIGKIENELEKEKDEHFYNEKLTNLFTAYRKELISSIRPTLADISSRLFNEMTDNKYSFVELDKEYNLRVMDQGQFYGIERFSGGEKDLANLCLRLAISLGLTESAGMRGSFIILDEVFGSQDINRKNNILKALAKLKNRFPQIILITHVDDIKDGIEQTINVVANEGGFSEVTIDDNAA